jgi:16S rRNA (guanine(966)-N(2))-methyltransferase RsmD
VRPTADRVKEALFSILLSRLGNLNGLKILDLFAGTGNLGIEALSRGADRAVFVDNSPQSVSLIRNNLQLTGFAANSEVISGDAVRVLKQLRQRKLDFDIIFLDPPYRDAEVLQKVLKEIDADSTLSPVGVIIVETDKGTTPPQTGQLTVLDRRIYGDTAITILGNNAYS